MKITCPACNASYRLPDEKIQGKNRIFKINCKRCGAEIRVRGVETADEAGRTTLPFSLDAAAPTPPPPAPVWFCGIDGKQVGPLTQAEVSDHIMAGRLGPDDLVWRKGFEAWKPVRTVPPFEDLVTGSPATAALGPHGRAPRRAQTLELSSAMIELLVKLDTQGSEPAVARPAAPAKESVAVPPVLPEDDEARTLSMPSLAPAAVAAPVMAMPVEQPPAIPEPADAIAPALPPRQTAPTPSSIQPARAVSGDHIKIGVARSDAPAVAMPAETATEVAARTTLGYGATAARPDSGRTEAAKPAMATAATAPTRPAAKADRPSVQVRVPNATTSGALKAEPGAAAPRPTPVAPKAPAKEGGSGWIVGVSLAVVAAVIGVIAMRGKETEPPAAETAAPAAVAIVTPPPPPPPAAPPPPVPAPTVVTPVAAAPEPDAGPAAAEADAGTDAATAVATAAPAPAAPTAEPKAADVKVEEKKAADAKAADAKAAEAKAADAKAADAKAEAAKAEAARAAEKKAAAAREAAQREAAAASEREAAAKRKVTEEKKGDSKKAAAEKAAAAKADKAAAARTEKKAAAEKAAAAKAEKAAKADAQKKAAAEKADAAKRAAAEKAEAAKAAAARTAEAKSAKSGGGDEDEIERILAKQKAKEGGAKAAKPADEPEPAKEKDAGPALTQTQVDAVGAKASPKVIRCYMLYADVDGGEETIKVQLAVNTDGSVASSKVQGKHAADQVGKCVSEAVKILAFPPSSGAQKKYMVRYQVGG